MPPTLRSIRACLEGAIPAIMATCAPDGTPNVAYISQVVYVDEQHVALSFQFFNKTRANILANPYASVLVLDPVTARCFRLHLRFLRTEAEGALFERMRAQLAGIASHNGMAGVFELKGSDGYAFERIEPVPGEGLAPSPAQLPRADLLGAVRLCSQRLARCTTLDELLQTLLAGLHEHLHVQHAMVLMLDAQAGHLYTVASHGYTHSGVGSEIKLGQGVIGVAAREATPVRISHMTHAALYSHAMRSSLGQSAPAHEIPCPGLPTPHSQLAVPLLSCGRTLGVLFVESPLDLQFRYPEEDALVALAGQLAAAIDLLQSADEATEASQESAPAPAPRGAPVRVRHFAVNDSVFGGSCCATMSAPDGRTSATVNCVWTPACACRAWPTTWRRACCCCSADCRKATPASISTRPAVGDCGCGWTHLCSWKRWPAVEGRAAAALT